MSGPCEHTDVTPRASDKSSLEHTVLLSALAQKWTRDASSLSPGSVERQQALRSETDVRAPDHPSLTAAASEAEQPKLEEAQAKLATPPYPASSDPPESASVSGENPFLDMLNATKAAVKANRQAGAAEDRAKREQESRERDERRAQQAPALLEEEKRRKRAEEAAFRAFVLTDDQTEEADKEAYKFFDVTMGDQSTPDDQEVQEMKNAIRKKCLETHPDKPNGSEALFAETKEYFKVLKKGRMKGISLPNERILSFGRSRMYV
jgi:hypothetical protein